MNTYHIFNALVDQAFDLSKNSGSLLRSNLQHSVVIDNTHSNSRWLLHQMSVTNIGPLYDVDVHMDIMLPHYHFYCDNNDQDQRCGGYCLVVTGGISVRGPSTYNNRCS
jgi:hypothetical protein